MARKKAEIPISEEPEEKLPPQESGVNFHQIAEERKALRQLHKNAPQEITDIIGGEIEAKNEEAKAFSAVHGGDFGKAKERIQKDKAAYETSAWLDELAIEKELGETYTVLAEIEQKLHELQDFEMRQLREGMSNPTARRVNEKVLPAVRAAREEREVRVDEIEHKHPTIFRGYELVSYKKGIHREGHIAPVPSTEKYLDEIGKRMIAGKPMFLHGPTGTGKTSLARYAAEHFTGRRAEMVYCNPQTRESNIWGKQGLRVREGTSAPETVNIYGPLAKAMRDGKTVIFDEFTALPQEQMVFVKGVLNAKPGDTVNVMGNGTVEIAPGFQIICTANLKSEKNKERQELPPEIAREFEQNNLEVRYTPKEESYNIVLARLMNPDGSVDMSMHDLTDTLPKLCKAMEEIQTAYTGEMSSNTARLTQTLDASNKAPGLKKLVFTQGTLENIIDGWKTERTMHTSGKTFTEYLDDRLKTALTFKEYPLADRVLAAKVLASVGLLRTVTPKELDLPDNVFGFEAAKTHRKDALSALKEKSGTLLHVPLSQLAEFDPFRLRQQKAMHAAEAFLPDDEQVEIRDETEPPATLDAFMRETFTVWGNAKEKIDAAKVAAEFISPDDIDWEARKADVDATKFGEVTLNPDMENFDFQTARVFIPDLKAMNGKPFPEVAKYIMNNYGSTYHIPGIEYWEYILKNPASAPASLKDGNYHFFWGSILRRASGDWGVPYVCWGASTGRFGRRANGLGSAWDSNYRVVLLEK